MRFVSESDKGIYDAMNKGIGMAQGEYLYFLNAGDQVHNLQTFTQIVSRLQGKDLYYCDIILAEAYQEELRSYPSQLDLPFWLDFHLCHQAVFFKRTLFKALGGYDIRYRFAADYEFFLRAWSTGKANFEYIPLIVCRYDLRGVSAQTANHDKVKNEYLRIQWRHLPKLEFVRKKVPGLAWRWLFKRNSTAVKVGKQIIKQLARVFVPDPPIANLNFYLNPDYSPQKGGLRVLHLSTYAGNGGAAVAAFRLTQALNNQGMQSQMACLMSDMYHPMLTGIRLKSGYHRLLNFAARAFEKLLVSLFRGSRRSIMSLGFNSDADWTCLQAVVKQFNPDVIHLHWINHRFLTIAQLAQLNRPIVWTFHDMWPFLGTEHISLTGEYENGFTQKQASDDHTRWIDRWVWLQKKQHWNQLAQKLSVVLPSQWMKEKTERSPLWQNSDLQVIPNSVNTREFYPVDRKLCRQLLELRSDCLTLVFGASSPFVEEVKGFDLFLKVVSALADKMGTENLQVITFGASWGRRMIKGVHHKHFEPIRSIELQRMIYSASDLMVVTSQIESFCLVAAEAQSCGIPVVCSDVAGLKDVVEHKVTGYRAQPESPDDFVTGITWIQQNSASLHSACRQRVEELFDYPVVAQKHIELYQRILKLTPQKHQRMESPSLPGSLTTLPK